MESKRNVFNFLFFMFSNGSFVFKRYIYKEVSLLVNCLI